MVLLGSQQLAGAPDPASKFCVGSVLPHQGGRRTLEGMDEVMDTVKPVVVVRVKFGSRGGSGGVWRGAAAAQLSLAHPRSVHLYRAMSIQTALTRDFPELSHLTCILRR